MSFMGNGALQSLINDSITSLRSNVLWPDHNRFMAKVEDQIRDCSATELREICAEQGLLSTSDSL